MRTIRAVATLGAAALLVAACGGGGTVKTSSATSGSSTLGGTPVTGAGAGAAVTSTSQTGAGGQSSTAAPHDLTFTSGPDTIYGTFQPAEGKQHPGVAVLIIPGSGAVDRNGNEPQQASGDTYQRFAETLASEGVSSLRYDKFATGQTGVVTHGDGKGITFDLYANEALDAYNTLAAQPGVDRHKLIILGHSEGGLYALWLANKLAGAPNAPHALILASTVGIRYLDLINAQFSAQYRSEAAAGTITSAEAAKLIQQLTTTVASIRAGQSVTTPLDDKTIATMASPINTPILQEEDQQDPAALAKTLGPKTPVLVLHGTKDSQVSTADTAPLLAALHGDSALAHDEVPNANHLYQQITGTPNPAADYLNTALPFASQVGPDLKKFLQQAF